MNIESTALTSVVPGSAIVETVSTPTVDGAVVSEGFSEALMVQIEMLSNLNVEDSVSLQAPGQAVTQSTNAPQNVTALTASETEVQNLAALLGNDLPPDYMVNDGADHQAALDAVTDTLKYINSGVSGAEKNASDKKNIQDILATSTLSSASANNMPKAEMPVPQTVGQENEQRVAADTAQQQALADNLQLVVSGEQTQSKPVDTGKSVESEQGANDVAVDRQAPNDAPLQMNFEQVKMDVEQKNAEPTDNHAQKHEVSDAQAASVTPDQQRIDELLSAVVVPVVIPAEQQQQSANNLTQAEAIKDDVPLALIKSTMADNKPSQMANVPAEVGKNETVLNRPEPSKQNFALNLGSSGQQAEKTVRLDPQGFEVEGVKDLPRVGADMIQPNKPVVDNKVDVPAIAKPLTHPEWNKDMGERIVWMSSKAIPSAEIRLNPEHLGPVSVRVDVTDDKASVMFTSQHAVVRETLEASIPKLREMMNSQQLDLVEVNISQGSVSDQGRSQSQTFAQTARQEQDIMDGAVNALGEMEQEIDSGRAVVSKGLLSLYA